MTLDERAATLARELRPLVARSMSDRQLMVADATLDAGEGYEALKWLFDAAETPGIIIPEPLLDGIRDCIQPEDMEEYASIIADQARRNR